MNSLEIKNKELFFNEVSFMNLPWDIKMSDCFVNLMLSCSDITSINISKNDHFEIYSEFMFSDECLITMDIRKGHVGVEVSISDNSDGVNGYHSSFYIPEKNGTFGNILRLNMDAYISESLEFLKEIKYDRSN